MPPYLDSKDTPDLGAVHKVRRQIFRFVCRPPPTPANFLTHIRCQLMDPFPLPFVDVFYGRPQLKLIMWPNDPWKKGLKGTSIPFLFTQEICKSFKNGFRVHIAE